MHAAYNESNTAEKRIILKKYNFNIRHENFQSNVDFIL